VVEAGKVAIIPTIPYSPAPELSSIPLYNAEIDAVISLKGCLTGPDLYSWFLANPGDLSPDGIHPSDTGKASIRSLWSNTIGD
jgi:hypothetical protein